MGIFSSILKKLGFGDDKPAPKAPPSTLGPMGPSFTPTPTRRPTIAISQVDVVAKLEALAAANPQTLNWKASIVDLMKLLDLDSSFAERKALAVELGCPADKMGDSAQMNMWLHKTVLRKLAENGGNVPRDLLD